MKFRLLFLYGPGTLPRWYSFGFNSFVQADMRAHEIRQSVLEKTRGLRAIAIYNEFEPMEVVLRNGETLHK